MDTNRVVVVTGGVSGIGRAVVGEFVNRGDQVIVFDRVGDPQDLPAGVDLVVGDVTDPDDNRRAVATAMDRYGRLDVFVGNAGVHDGGLGLLDLDLEQAAAISRKVFDVNVMGYLLGARAAADALVRSRGCMVFTLSDASFVVRGNGAGIGYTIAKHAALGLVRHLAGELAPDVRVNAVAPGGVVTGLQAVEAEGRGSSDVFAAPEDIAAAVREFNPLGVVLSPQQVAAAYVFLASSAALGMTGEVLRCDGGLSVR